MKYQLLLSQFFLQAGKIDHGYRVRDAKVIHLLMNRLTALRFHSCYVDLKTKSFLRLAKKKTSTNRRQFLKKKLYFQNSSNDRRRKVTSLPENSEDTSEN